MGHEKFISRMNALNFMVISGWAGTGKTTLSKNEELSKKFNFIDLDSSYVRKKYDSLSSHYMPFHTYYVQQIFVKAKRALLKDKTRFPIILISAHQDVIQSVISHRIPLIIVFPHKDRKYEYLYNLYKRIPDGPIEEVIQLPQYRAWKYSIDHIDEMYAQADSLIEKYCNYDSNVMFYMLNDKNLYISNIIDHIDKICFSK